MTFAIILKKIVTGEVTSSPFFLALAHCILFLPLQGLFNFIVYVHPKISVRMRHRDLEDVGHPWKFILSFRDVIMSNKGRLRTALNTRRSTAQLLSSPQPNNDNQNEGRSRESDDNLLMSQTAGPSSPQNSSSNIQDSTK